VATSEPIDKRLYDKGRDLRSMPRVDVLRRSIAVVGGVRATRLRTCELITRTTRIVRARHLVSQLGGVASTTPFTNWLTSKWGTLLSHAAKKVCDVADPEFTLWVHVLPINRHLVGTS
jgi:hypothetical protein